MLGVWDRLKRASVWGRPVGPDEDIDDLLDTRFFLPVFDIGLIILGFVGAHFCVPALDENYPSFVADLVAYTLSTLGFIALIAVSFPRLEVIEASTKIIIMIALVVYPGTLILTAFGGDWQRLFAGIGLGLLVIIPMRRFVKLVGQIYAHRQEWKHTQEIKVVGTND
mgnify:CR=1 FL=1